jgi:hypothetical protein
MEDRWKRRTAPKHSVVFGRPRTLVLEEAAPAGEAALYRAEEVTPAPTPAVDEVRARFDQLRVDKRIRDSLIDWPPESCLHCRKPIIVGQLWAVVSNGEVSARFHQNCHSEWLAQQEVAARRVLGLAA